MTDDNQDMAIIQIRTFEKQSEYAASIAMIHDFLQLIISKENYAILLDELSRKYKGWYTYRISKIFFCRVIIEYGVIERIIIYHLWTYRFKRLRDAKLYE